MITGERQTSSYIAVRKIEYIDSADSFFSQLGNSISVAFINKSTFLGGQILLTDDLYLSAAQALVNGAGKGNNNFFNTPGTLFARFVDGSDSKVNLRNEKGFNQNLTDPYIESCSELRTRFTQAGIVLLSHHVNFFNGAKKDTLETNPLVPHIDFASKGANDYLNTHNYYTLVFVRNGDPTLYSLRDCDSTFVDYIGKVEELKLFPSNYGKVCLEDFLVSLNLDLQETPKGYGLLTKGIGAIEFRDTMYVDSLIHCASDCRSGQIRIVEKIEFLVRK